MKITTFPCHDSDHLPCVSQPLTYSIAYGEPSSSFYFYMCIQSRPDICALLCYAHIADGLTVSMHCAGLILLCSTLLVLLSFAPHIQRTALILCFTSCLRLSGPTMSMFCLCEGVIGGVIAFTIAHVAKLVLDWVAAKTGCCTGANTPPVEMAEDFHITPKPEAKTSASAAPVSHACPVLRPEAGRSMRSAPSVDTGKPRSCT